MKQKAMPGIELYLGFAPVLIILVIAILGVAGYFGYKYFKTPNQPSPTPTANSSRAESRDWKTYTNGKLGFYLKYPSNWVIITDADRVVGWSTFIANNKDRMLATESLQINIEYSNIFEVPWSNGKTVVITKDNLGYYAYSGNTPATSIFQNRPAIKRFDSSPLYGAHTSLKILDGARLVEIKVDTKDDKNITIHDQVLSTFKFTQTGTGQ